MSCLNQYTESLDFIWLEITKFCNLKCSHCYSESSPEQDLFGTMLLEDWKSVINASLSKGCKKCQFIGGEPTLHPELYEMITFAKKKGMSFIEVFTNATCISDELVSLMKANDVRIAFSIYSSQSTIHDRVTGVSGSWKRTTENVEKLMANGISVRAAFIETPLNEGEAGNTIKYLNSIGISETQIRIDRQRAVGRSSTCKEDFSVKNISKSINSHEKEDFNQLCGSCGKGRLCFTSSGAVYPCIFSRKTYLGDIKKQNLDKIIGSDHIENFRKKLSENLKIRSKCLPGTCPPTCPPNELCPPEPIKKPDSCVPSEDVCIPIEVVCTPSSKEKCLPVIDCIPFDENTCTPRLK